MSQAAETVELPAPPTSDLDPYDPAVLANLSYSPKMGR